MLVKTNAKIRIIYLILAAAFVAAGLLSRKVGSLPDFIGDALWAMLVYCCWRILLPGRSRLISALLALAVSFAVEFSQLISAEWLDKIRSTFIGHMLLGQGFLWTDLIAYTGGVAVILLITTAFGTLRKKGE